MANIQDISCGRMCLGPSPQTKVRTLDLSSKASAVSKTKPHLFLRLRSGFMQDLSWEMVTPSPGECLTLNTSEYPKEENESFLSQILEANAPEKYYLSQRACLGILRRASERGKELPDVLKRALEKQAKSA